LRFDRAFISFCFPFSHFFFSSHFFHLVFFIFLSSLSLFLSPRVLLLQFLLSLLFAFLLFFFSTERHGDRSASMQLGFAARRQKAAMGRLLGLEAKHGVGLRETKALRAGCRRQV
jgi:hypothetical protein